MNYATSLSELEVKELNYLIHAEQAGAEEDYGKDNRKLCPPEFLRDLC